MANKVMFNLKNVYYATVTEKDNGTFDFGKPVRLPGTTELTMELEQSSEKHYSEGVVYYITTASAGYKGELSIFNVDTAFEEAVLGIKKDAKGVQYEDMYAQPNEIALLFEIDGNEKAERHCLYRLKFSKPKYEYKTNTDKTDVQTLKLSYEGLSVPTGDKSIGRVKANKDTDEATYNKWFEAVYKITEGEAA